MLVSQGTNEDRRPITDHAHAGPTVYDEWLYYELALPIHLPASRTLEYKLCRSEGTGAARRQGSCDVDDGDGRICTLGLCQDHMVTAPAGNCT